MWTAASSHFRDLGPGQNSGGKRRIAIAVGRISRTVPADGVGRFRPHNAEKRPCHQLPGWLQIAP